MNEWIDFTRHPITGYKISPSSNHHLVRRLMHIHNNQTEQWGEGIQQD